jgi:hypothetical protein
MISGAGSVGKPFDGKLNMSIRASAALQYNGDKIFEIGK